MKDLTFNVNMEEANLILEALGKMPFERVFGLVNKVQSQAQAQLKQEQNGNGKTSEEKATKIGI